MNESPAEVIENQLKEWGVWKVTAGLAQGWGGGVDGHVGGKRGAGSHSNPVLAEVLRTLKDGQGMSALIDAFLAEHPQRDRAMVLTHYVGEKEVKTTHLLRVDGDIQIGAYDHRRIYLQRKAPLHTGYSGWTPAARVAEIHGVSVDVFYRTIRRVKRRLQLELSVALRVRKGRTGEVRRAIKA